MWYKKLIRNAVIASLAILALEWWAGVFTHESKPPFKVWQDTTDEAEFDHLDYGALLHRCVKGDTDALRMLMQYSMKVRRSGAGSYGHGAAMLEVLWIIGDAPFTSTLSCYHRPRRKRFYLCSAAVWSTPRFASIPDFRRIVFPGFDKLWWIITCRLRMTLR